MVRPNLEERILMKFPKALLIGAGIAALAACTPTVRIEPSDKPIKIELDCELLVQDWLGLQFKR